MGGENFETKVGCCAYLIQFLLGPHSMSGAMHESIESRQLSFTECEDKDVDMTNSKKHVVTKCVKMVHKESLCPCLHCGYRCAENLSLNNHNKFIHEADEFVCFKCGYKDNTLSSVQKHSTSDHSNLPSSCQNCEQLMPSKLALNKHMEGSDKENVSKCHDCQYNANSSNNLIRHQKKMHAECDYNENFLQDCDLCRNWFYKRSVMN